MKDLLHQSLDYMPDLNALYDELEGHVTENPLKLALSCHMANIQAVMTELEELNEHF